MPADYPKKDGKCAVEITHGDLINISEFDSMRGGVDGRRVRRPAISFAHAARQHRKDATSGDVKLKVQRQYECATNVQWQLINTTCGAGEKTFRYRVCDKPMREG